MWVADTEFPAPDFILNAIQKRLDHGILGYTLVDDDYYNSIIDWLYKIHGWQIRKDWIAFSPGVVPSLYASVLAFTQPDDKIIVQTPVYYPFYSAIRETGRQLIKNPLKIKNGRYYMDFDDFKSKIDEKVKLLFLCSPHNPTGNVWRKEELLELADICLKNNIHIISDEIHADIVYKNFKHIPTASLSPEIAANTITLMAPSKTFNIAGLNSSYVIASDAELLKKLSFYFGGMHIGPTVFAIEATKAAYMFGYNWLQELIDYYRGNIDFVRNFLKKNIPKIELIEPEGTFLLWLSFKNFGLPRKKINEILIHDASLGFSDGFVFGVEGEGFWRMNIGCSKIELEKALNSLYNAFKNI